MYCFNSTYCVPLPASSQEECEETPVCVLLDGEVLWGVGGDDCERRMTCSDPAITGEDECLASGDCVDPDLIQESIEVRYFKNLMEFSIFPHIFSPFFLCLFPFSLSKRP